MLCAVMQEGSLWRKRSLWVAADRRSRPRGAQAPTMLDKLHRDSLWCAIQPVRELVVC